MSSGTVSHPIFARVYARCSGAMEKAGIAEKRVKLLAGVRGTVLEVGAGNGLNFPHYPAGVDSVLAVEPDPYLRRQAVANAGGAGVPIEVVDGTAESIPARGRIVGCGGPVAGVVLRRPAGSTKGGSPRPQAGRDGALPGARPGRHPRPGSRPACSGRYGLAQAFRRLSHEP